MKFTVLGSGTSTGVPNVGCDCDVCTSSDVRDNRLRTSLLIESDLTTVLIDTSSDFRQQMLRHRVMKIDGVVFTHHHFDHIGGFDDIRPYNFNVGAPMPIHVMQETLNVLEYTFPYAFGKVPSSGTSTPSVDVRIIDRDPFTIGDITLQPIPLYHGSSLRVNGYRIGNVAYCTDTNLIPVPSMELLKGLDVLILDGLRWEPHPTHFTIGESLRIVDQLQPKVTYLTHIAHQIKHAETEAQLPDTVYLAYDGLTIRPSSVVHRP